MFPYYVFILLYFFLYYNTHNLKLFKIKIINFNY